MERVTHGPVVPQQPDEAFGEILVMRQRPQRVPSPCTMTGWPLRMRAIMV